MLKKTIITVIIISTLMISLPAGAATTCLCVGFGNSKTCGNGGAGGSFLTVRSASTSNLVYYLLTAQKLAELNSAGKAFNGDTGWFCWTGNLQ